MIFEEIGSPVENWEATGLTVQASYVVPWATRKDAVAWLLAGGGHVYPRWPAMNCRAQKVTVRPYTPRQVGAQTLGSVVYGHYAQAVLSVEYATSGRDQVNTGQGAALVTEKLTGTAEFMTLNPGRFRWSGETHDPVSEEEAPGFQIRGLQYDLIYHDLLTMPGAVFTLQGCVNNAPVRPHTFAAVFGPETLMLVNVAASPVTKTDGSPAWEVALGFGYRASGWNRYWRTESQSWESIQVYSQTEEAWVDYKSYPPQSFASLF